MIAVQERSSGYEVRLGEEQRRLLCYLAKLNQIDPREYMRDLLACELLRRKEALPRAAWHEEKPLRAPRPAGAPPLGWKSARLRAACSEMGRPFLMCEIAALVPEIPSRQISAFLSVFTKKGFLSSKLREGSSWLVVYSVAEP